MMADIIKAPIDIRDEEDAFLVPPGQPGSDVDALAAAQRWATMRTIVIEIFDNDIGAAVTITEVRHV
ncbi:hypothetical protein IED13_10700 [Bosea sp. SSUT16]|jgi:hypothetical protein|uniref:Uncharacterized protein n=1 Tax=Bosea spartocytisi TaxID=2773451 RepID=A0A927E8F9_9HYPH|nr:hypothetical protein [Bosea spartocytisi]MBD3846167.1 hypothetical protein [Bosea spartocytisi]MCT4473351.1 hypothetical protein [Bosea spartocytisi]